MTEQRNELEEEDFPQHAHLGLKRHVDTELGAIDRRMSDATDEGERGAALLDRAILMQGSDDPVEPAGDATEAFELLARAGRREEAALAAAAASGLVFRTDDVETAVDLAVEAMMLLENSAGSVHAARALNNISLLFWQISAFEYSREFSLRALAALEMAPLLVGDVVHYTHAVIHIEAWYAGEPLPFDTARRSAVAMSGADSELTRGLLGAGVTAELAMIDAPDSIASLDLDETVLANANPRIGAWFRMVAARIHHARGDQGRAASLLDEAIPVLATVRDDHRLVRSYELRSRVRSELGDHGGALADSNARGDTIRRWHTQQVGRLATQIAQRAELERMRVRLEREANELTEEMHVDALTRVGSRRLFNTALDELTVGPVRDIAVVVIDLDHFKRVNDTFGHSAGDDVLRRVGGVLRSAARADDVIARLGGEEFVALFPGAGVERALEYADEVRSRLRRANWDDIGHGIAVRASAGVAAGYTAEVSEVVDRADEALYEAKAQGRDRSVVAEPPSAVNTRPA